MNWCYLSLLWPITGIISCILCFLFLKLKDGILGDILFFLLSPAFGFLCLWFFIDSYIEENPTPVFHVDLQKYNEIRQLEIITERQHHYGFIGKHKIHVH